MAGLKRIVGVTLAVVLVAALVVFVLRPSANTTTSTAPNPGTPTTQPPPGTCSQDIRSHQKDECGTNGGGQGSDPNGTGDSDDHEGSDDGHDGSDGNHDANETGDQGDHWDRDDGEVEELD